MSNTHLTAYVLSRELMMRFAEVLAPVPGFWREADETCKWDTFDGPDRSNELGSTSHIVRFAIEPEDVAKSIAVFSDEKLLPIARELAQAVMKAGPGGAFYRLDRPQGVPGCEVVCHRRMCLRLLPIYDINNDRQTFQAEIAYHH